MAASGTKPDLGPAQAVRREMAQLWRTQLDNVWGDKDPEPGLLILNLYNQTGYTPAKPYIRQLVALALAPPSPSPPLSASVSHLKSTNPTSDHSLDPLNPTSRQICLAALHALRSIATRHGARAVIRALPGYGMPDPVPAQLEEINGTPAPSSPRKKRRIEKSEDEESLSDDDDESALARAGRRVAKCEDGWDLLRGKGLVKPAKSQTDDNDVEEAVADPSGWQLLGALVAIWEEELTRDPHLPISLLSQFRPSSLDDHAPRTVSSKCLDVVMLAFGPSSEEDDSASDVAGQADGVEVDGKRELTVKLLALLGSLASADRVDGGALLRSLSLRLKSLSPGQLVSFFDALAPCPPLFTTRLCALYLSLHTRPPTTPSSLPTPASSNTPGHPPRSPAKRLGPQSSQSSLPSSTKPAFAGLHPPPSEVRSAFAAPKLDEVLALLRRVPNELPRKDADVVQNTVESPAESTPRTLRRPLRRSMAAAETPRSKKDGRWEAVERAAKGQRVVKACLVRAVEAWLASQDPKQARKVWGGLRVEGAKALREADEEVEAARGVAERA